MAEANGEMAFIAQDNDDNIYPVMKDDLLILLAQTESKHLEGINRRGIILKLLTILKQVCNHPLQYLKNDNEVRPEQSGKMMLLGEKWIGELSDKDLKQLVALGE